MSLKHSITWIGCYFHKRHCLNNSVGLGISSMWKVTNEIPLLAHRLKTIDLDYKPIRLKKFTGLHSCLLCILIPTHAAVSIPKRLPTTALWYVFLVGLLATPTAKVNSLRAGGIKVLVGTLALKETQLLELMNIDCSVCLCSLILTPKSMETFHNLQREYHLLSSELFGNFQVKQYIVFPPLLANQIIFHLPLLNLNAKITHIPHG